MKNKISIISTANITVGISLQILSLLILFLFAYGLDSKFEHPFVWLFLGTVFILITLYSIKKFPFTIELGSKQNIKIIKLRNPFIMYFILAFFPKNIAQISTFTGTYKYFYKDDKVCIVQINNPKSIDCLKDLLILFLTLIVLIALYTVLSNIDIVKYGLAIIISFVYTSIFIEKLAIRWCYFKFSFEYKEGINITPLIINKSQLATTAFKKVLLSPNVLNYSDSIISYVIQHEKGHIKSFDNIKGFLEDLCTYSFALIYCYTQITNPNVASLVFIPIIVILFMHPLLVTYIELKADEYAAKQLGIDFCINSLNQLNFKIKDNQLIEEFSFLGVLLRTFGILKGNISIQNRIKHLKSISKQ